MRAHARDAACRRVLICRHVASFGRAGGPRAVVRGVRAQGQRGAQGAEGQGRGRWESVTGQVGVSDGGRWESVTASCSGAAAVCCLMCVASCSGAAAVCCLNKIERALTWKRGGKAVGLFNRVVAGAHRGGKENMNEGSGRQSRRSCGAQRPESDRARSNAAGAGWP